MSYASASVITSASSPSITALACPPDPPCDFLIVTVWPVFAFEYLTNAALNSWYNSRVGSYDTFNSVCAQADVPNAASAAPKTSAPTIPFRVVIHDSDLKRHLRAEDECVLAAIGSASLEPRPTARTTLDRRIELSLPNGRAHRGPDARMGRPGKKKARKRSASRAFELA